MCRISDETTWKGARAFALENDALRVTVLPEHGSRVASLVHRPTGREILWWPDDLDILPAPTYAMPYADQPAVGIDECIPTIWADTFRGAVAARSRRGVEPAVGRQRDERGD